MPNIGDSLPGSLEFDAPKPRTCFNHLGSPKYRFISKAEAKTALKRMVHKTYKGVPMQRNAKIYRCQECSFYHIGHNS